MMVTDKEGIQKYIQGQNSHTSVLCTKVKGLEKASL